MRWMERIRKTQPLPAGPAWAALAGISAAAAFLYVLMEWVFFATKPSFMSTLGTEERVRILLLAPLPLAGICAAVCGALGLVARFAPRTRNALALFGAGLPGFLLAATAWLLLDNFTYSLFGFGVATSSGFGRGAHLATFAALWAAGWKWAWGRVRGVLAGRRPGRTLAAWGGALAAGWAILLATAPDRAEAPAPTAEGARAGRRLPNVVVLASDGVSAEHLSLYGYARDTTPFMRTFRPDRALLCENAFANSLNSGGSIASLLAGKQTTALRMYYPPEILTGRNAYEHLPGLLRQLGYWNVDVSARHFADAYDLNMQHAFQEANGRTERAGRWPETAAAILGLNAGYFLGATGDRVGERLLHATGVRNADQTYRQVAGEAAGTTQDDEPRIARIERLIADPAARPFFVHAHLMETHGPKFNLERPVFSAGREQQEAFETDFYDDAILELDAAFARIVRALEAAGQLDRTVLVLSSDHGKGWGSGRIPLVFWFPDGAPAGRIRTNVQNVDVAPTILDYLGLPVPEWMEGVSLLDGEPPATRPIFLTAVNSRLVDTRDWVLDPARLKPPFYSLGTIGMRVGDRSHLLDLTTGHLSMEPVPGHTNPLPEDAIPPASEARQILLDHLARHGYEIPDELATPEK